jgi:hypothetical protein
VDAAAEAAETQAGAAADTNGAGTTTSSLARVGAAAAAAAAAGSAEVDGGDGVSGVVLCVYLPVPYTLPPASYASSTGVDRPWCLDEHFPGRDRFGDPCPNLSRH